MKTADEIKKGLECCARGDCHSCPYVDNCILSTADVLALIQQLESDKQQLEGLLTHMSQLRDAAAGRALQMEERVRQLEAERDALMRYLINMGCESCLYEECDAYDPPCINCTAERDLWQWRGLQKEE